jgi:hypothetical protein
MGLLYKISAASNLYLCNLPYFWYSVSLSEFDITVALCLKV